MVELLHSPADILLQLLVDKELVALPSGEGEWKGYVSNEPDSPDKAVTVTDTGGTSGSRLQPTGEYLDRPTVQIRVRDATQNSAWQKIYEIQQALDTEVLGDSVTIGGSNYEVSYLTRTTGILSLGRESPESKRVLFSINYSILIGRG